MNEERFKIMFDYDALGWMLFGFICMLVLSILIALGTGIAKAATYEVDAEYQVEATVTKVDSHKNDSGMYSYKVYAVSENGNVYFDNITEEKYALINVGDTVVFDIVESSTCFGEKFQCTYVD